MIKQLLQNSSSRHARKTTLFTPLIPHQGQHDRRHLLEAAGKS